MISPRLDNMGPIRNQMEIFQLSYILKRKLEGCLALTNTEHRYSDLRKALELEKHSTLNLPLKEMEAIARVRIEESQKHMINAVKNLEEYGITFEDKAKYGC